MKTAGDAVRMPASYDPYGDLKVYHYAAHQDQHGDVSALCYKKPRAIRGNKQRWTLRVEDVTCEKCKEELAQRIFFASMDRAIDRLEKELARAD